MIGLVHMANTGIPFIQINLQHSKSASAVLVRSMAMLQTGICLVQEPWVHAGGIRGIGSIGRIFRDPVWTQPRACIIVKGLDALLMPKWCTKDLSVVRVELPWREGRMRTVVVA